MCIFEKNILMELNRENQLRELLDNQHDWPEIFSFKFIYKANIETEEKLKGLFKENSEIIIKSSKKENYISMTVKHLSSSADEIMNIYAEASKIGGVISL